MECTSCTTECSSERCKKNDHRSKERYIRGHKQQVLSRPEQVRTTVTEMLDIQILKYSK